MEGIRAHIQGNCGREERRRAKGPPHRFRRSQSDGRRCHRARRMVDGELQGRARAHRQAPVVRRFPMIAGIDFAGTVESSTHPQWKPGDRVILNGWGLGETHLGGYAEKARVKGDWLVRLPARNSARDAMAIGTAGFTAMLAVMALERHGVTPRHGPVIVTGAAGGLGSVAVALLARLGFAVIASTGRPSEADYLRSLGAREVIERKQLVGAAKPLGQERWPGGIDTVGSTTLANVLSM